MTVSKKFVFTFLKPMFFIAGLFIAVGCEAKLTTDSIDKRSAGISSSILAPILSSNALAEPSLLPICDEIRDTQLTYIFSEQKFYHCSSGSWNMVILQGEPGPQGETGPQGSIGEKGAKGENGENGSTSTSSAFAANTGAPDDTLTINADGSIAIGHTTSPRAVLETHGAVGHTAAIFGGEGAGVSIIRDWPEINFNAYYNSGSKSLAAGFGGSMELDPTTGDILITTSSAAAIGPDESHRRLQDPYAQLPNSSVPKAA